jgi:succinoglycan biosynthesis transport protein ExoP
MRRIPDNSRPDVPDSRTDEAPENVYRGPTVADFQQIRDCLRIVSRRRWMILSIMVAGLLSSLLYNARATRIFEASAILQIGADPNVLGLERPLVDQRDWMREFLPTQLAVLESRELARMATEELEIPNRSTGRGERQLVSAGEIADGRIISPLSNTRLVSIGFRSADPALAAQVANALARAYVKWNTVSKASTTGEASDWLKGQVEEQRRVVQKSEAALQQYKKEHGAEALGERQNIVVQKLGELQSAATRAKAETIEKQTQYQQLSTLESTHGALDTLPAIASNLYIHGIKDELASLQQQLAQASGQLGELHPDIIKLQGAVEAAERKLRTEISKVAAAIRNEYQAARARELALVAAFERQKLEVQALNAKAVEYTALDRTATANRLLLDNLEQRSKQITLARDLPSASASLLDLAEIPGAPIKPRKERNVMLGVAGSGALALTLVFLLEMFNTRITSPEDVKRHLGIPVLGVAPRVKLQNGHASLLLSDGAPPELAELLHGVRTNLVMASELASARTLLVTSSKAGEGKTLTAANLAVSLARLNQRVLLIDADLRRPRLHELFGEEPGPGLTDLLTGKATTRAVRKTKVARLWLIPSGSDSRRPADLLGSEHFKKLIDCLRPQVEWVIIDSPPVLAVADACVIARVVAGVLLVVGSGKTSRDVACAAVERLDAVGAKIVGAMLNLAVLDGHGESYLPYYHRDSQTYYSQQEDSFSPEVSRAPSNGASAGAAAPHVQSDGMPPQFVGFTIATSDAEATRGK